METQVIITFKLKSDQVDAFKEHISEKLFPTRVHLKAVKTLDFISTLMTKQT